VDEVSILRTELWGVFLNNGKKEGMRAGNEATDFFLLFLLLPLLPSLLSLCCGQYSVVALLHHIPLSAGIMMWTAGFAGLVMGDSSWQGGKRKGSAG